MLWALGVGPCGTLKTDIKCRLRAPGPLALSAMTIVRPSNKEEEAFSSSLSGILVALVHAVDRLAVAVEGKFHAIMCRATVDQRSRRQSTSISLIPTRKPRLVPSRAA